MHSKARLQQMLHTYEQRKREYKIAGIKTTAGKRIKALKRSLKIYEKREQIVLTLASKVLDYTGIDVRHKKGKQNSEVTLSKYLFYKAGLESGIKGSHLQWCTGDTHPSTCYTARQIFTKSFTDKSRYLFWQKWKQHLITHDTTKMASNNTRLSNRSQGKREETSRVLDPTGQNKPENSKEIQRSAQIHT